LSELELSRQLGISRGPIREALAQLSAEGVVDLIPNRGAFVRGLASRDVKEIYTARYLLEGFLVELAAENGREDELQALLEAATYCEECVEGGDLKAAIEADLAFHRLIWAISGHSLIEGLLLRMEAQIKSFIATHAPLYAELRDSTLDHPAIAHAMSQRMGKQARGLMERHIETTGKEIIAWLGAQGAERQPLE